jgi:hypothetical protein
MFLHLSLLPLKRHPEKIQLTSILKRSTRDVGFGPFLSAPMHSVPALGVSVTNKGAFTG